MRRAGSAALDLAYVASGRLEGFWEFNLNPWDTAAGILLVEEAGGRATIFAGGPFRLNSEETLVSNGLIHDELVRIFSTDKTTVVMITNDVDEGILVADRIIPLSMGPGATLGPVVEVDIARWERDRKGINHCPRFKTIRKRVFDYLLGPGRRGVQAAAAVEAGAVAPQLQPAEFGRKRGAATRAMVEAAA